MAIVRKYGVNQPKLSEIINNPSNKFPAPEIIGCNGRIMLFCPDKVERWLNGRDWKSIPYRNRICNKQNKQRGGSTYMAREDFGVGGKAEGELLKVAALFYKALAGLDYGL
jgi:hypothetical protein